MYLKNGTIQDLLDTIGRVNAMYDDNIIFNRLEEMGNKVIFTLKVKDSKGSGSVLSPSGRRTASACWHVHGNFFELLLATNPECEVKSMYSTINKDGGNWKDYKVGSAFYMQMASDLCEC